MEFTLKDVVFEAGNVLIAFVHDYNGTGWPGLVVRINDGEKSQQIEAPLGVMHAVQLCSFSFTSLVQKLDDQDNKIEELKAKFEDFKKSEKPAEIIPFKPRSV